MAKKYFSERNLKFLLYEVFDAESLTAHEYYGDHNKKTFDLVLNSAGKIAKDLLWPIFEEMDRNPPELENGTIKVHPNVKKIMREFGQGGWISTIVPYELDGEQLPHLIACACSFIFMAANYSASVYTMLCDCSARLIENFGSKDLYDCYVPNMRAGKWQGTMALTEPEAGSSLSDLTTTAKPTDKGHYLIFGQKIFISGGDSDAVDNVVHLLLGKIEVVYCPVSREFRFSSYPNCVWKTAAPWSPMTSILPVSIINLDTEGVPSLNSVSATKVNAGDIWLVSPTRGWSICSR